MSVTYTRITREEFEDFLSELTPAWETAEVPGTKEIVYDLPLPEDHLTIRIFSSLDRTGQARDVGADAIRTLLWNHETDSVVYGMTKTLRVDTWRSNLKPKIRELYDNWREHSGDFSVQDLPDSTGADNEIRLLELADTRYGRKGVLESPPPWETPDDMEPANEAIKALPWDETHRAWDEDRNAWTIDADSLEMARDELAPEWMLTKGPAPQDFHLPEVHADDRIRVHYEPKNRENLESEELTKEGRVLVIDGNEVAFRRDDGQVMYVRGDELHTANSAYPFVGTVFEVEVL